MAVYYKGREINEIDYVKVEENIVEVNNQNKTIDITENGTQTITYDEGYNGLESVVINTNVETSSGGYEIPDETKFSYSNWTELPSFVLSFLEKTSDWKYMFHSCSNLEGTIDLTSVTNTYTINMGSFLSSSTKIEYVNISNLKVSNLSSSFSVMSKLKEINFTNIDISTVNNVLQLFAFCSKLEKINISGWTYPTSMSQIKYKDSVFGNCYSLTSLILGDVTQEQYDWWYARLTDVSIQDNVTITYNIIS